LSSLVKQLLEQVKSKVLDRYCGVSITQYKLNKYTFIHVEVIDVLEDRPVKTIGYVNVLIKKEKKREKIVEYAVRIRGNRQLEYDIRKLLKTLKQQSRRAVKEAPAESSGERREN
jgi:hypothetical protein